MALQFPTDPTLLDENLIVDANLIERSWEYNREKNRWEIIKFDSLSFTSELPITNYERDGDIVHDYDIQDLDRA